MDKNVAGKRFHIQSKAGGFLVPKLINDRANRRESGFIATHPHHFARRVDLCGSFQPPNLGLNLKTAV